MSIIKNIIKKMNTITNGNHVRLPEDALLELKELLGNDDENNPSEVNFLRSIVSTMISSPCVG